MQPRKIEGKRRKENQILVENEKVRSTERMVSWTGTKKVKRRKSTAGQKKTAPTRMRWDEMWCDVMKKNRTIFNWIGLRAYFRLCDGINCGNCFICITNMIEKYFKYFKYLILIRFAEKDFNDVRVHVNCALCTVSCAGLFFFLHSLLSVSIHPFQPIISNACRCNHCNHCNHFITFSHFISRINWIIYDDLSLFFFFCCIHSPPLIQIIIHSARDCILSHFSWFYNSVRFYARIGWISRKNNYGSLHLIHSRTYGKK